VEVYEGVVVFWCWVMGYGLWVMGHWSLVLFDLVIWLSSYMVDKVIRLWGERVYGHGSWVFGYLWCV